MKSLNYLMVLFTVFFSFTTHSCKKLDRIISGVTELREQTVLALNDGVNTLQNESSDWQSVLKDLELKIDKRINDILTYNIPYIINYASQRALSTILCIKESIKDDVIYFLEVAIAELITGVKPPLPATKICLTSILTIDLNAPRSIRNQVVYTGYNIHTKDFIIAYLINVNTGTKTEIPRSKLGFPDISNITLSLVDYSDAILNSYTHLELYYNEEVISSIGIDKKVIVPPVVLTEYTKAETIVFIPPHTYGDRDHKGNGPTMISHVTLKCDATRVYAQIYLYARETKYDWTTASGYSVWKEIYRVPSGYRINSIKDPKSYRNILRVNGKDYVDTSIEDHIMETVVGRATLVGDADGNEAGTRTKITLSLKRFKIEIQKL